MPGLIPCAVSLCERRPVSLTVAALSRERILLYLYLYLYPPALS